MSRVAMQITSSLAQWHYRLYCTLRLKSSLATRLDTVFSHFRKYFFEILSKCVFS